MVCVIIGHKLVIVARAGQIVYVLLIFFLCLTVAYDCLFILEFVLAELSSCCLHFFFPMQNNEIIKLYFLQMVLKLIMWAWLGYLLKWLFKENTNNVHNLLYIIISLSLSSQVKSCFKYLIEKVCIILCNTFCNNYYITDISSL